MSYNYSIKHNYSIKEEDCIKTHIVNYPKAFTAKDVCKDFPFTDEKFILSILDDCVNSGIIGYDMTTGAFVSNYHNDLIEEVKPTIFDMWKDSLTIEDFREYLIHHHLETILADCKESCPAFNICRNPEDFEDRKGFLCRCPEEFVKWANSEVNNND